MNAAPAGPTALSPTPGRTLDCDVLVVGSGAGGLSAAVTAAYHGLKVIVVEKADVCGGATSWSGGWAWTPGNPLAKAAGVNEDKETFRTYLRHRLGEDYQADKVDAFLEAVPHMVGLLPGQNLPAVRPRRQNQRHLRQDPRRRHRTPLGRSQTPQRPQP